MMLYIKSISSTNPCLNQWKKIFKNLKISSKGKMRNSPGQFYDLPMKTTLGIFINLKD